MQPLPPNPGIDLDKLPTSPVETVFVDGVQITSRYQKQAELEAMAQAVSAMPGEIRGLLGSLWCDSKMGSHYHGELRSGAAGELVEQLVANHLAKHFADGYGMVTVGQAEIEGNWL